MGKLVKHNGSMAISHGDKIYPPMMATIANVDNGKYKIDRDYLRNLGANGIKIYFLICDTEWIRPDAFDKLDEEVKILLEEVPDALIMLRIGLHPSNEWVMENLDECLTMQDGSHPGAYLATESYYKDMPACYTLYSDKWRKKAGEYLKDTYDRLMQKPYADRITGVFIAAGNTSEWRQLGPITDPLNGVYGDFSEALRREYSLYLREKYGTEENLRKAWDDPEATFDNPRIPNMEERYYAMDARYDLAGIDYDVNKRWKNPNHEVLPSFYEDDTHIGSFLNVDKYMSVYDFYRARSNGAARSLIYFGELVKEMSDNNLLVGAFYGNYGACHFTQYVSISCVYDVLKSGVVDIFSAPGTYQNRQRGGFEGQRCMYDSMRINGSMFVVEDDTRTHADPTEYCHVYDLFGIEDDIDVLKRNFGRNICDDLQGWWFDQLWGGGRYKFDETYALFNEQSKIAEEAYSLDRAKKHEIAFIYDEESVHMIAPKSLHDTVEYMRNYEVARIGAGVDQYYHNDMSNPDMPDYKLYVFFNVYSLSNEEREAIKAKLRKNNATAMFMYGNGVINFDAEQRFSTANMTDLMGMEIEMENNVRVPLFRKEGDHEAAKDMEKGRSYGDLDRHIRLSAVGMNDWEIGNYERGYLAPCFSTKEGEGEVIARFRETGKPAMTINECDGYKAVFCGTKVVRAAVIRSIARYAGCHIWEDGDDVLFQNDNYVTIHASSAGEKTIHLPRKCTPYEVYEKKNYGENTDTIKVDMYFGETKMFRLK
ncbi:MAG: hypothetical protein KIG65_07680 [Eubacteriales bacterium]|nr:hypothetical protein [Eubacteriales bacterium]